jgi:2'-5' RNA ligase
VHRAKKLFMRIFFAIDLPNEAREVIRETISNLRKIPQFKPARWVKPENLHITLKFLGNITPEQYNCIVEHTKISLQNSPDFTITLSSLQAFPSTQKPHVLILKTAPLNILTPLALLLDKIAVNCGIPTENRSFAPHLTIARLSGKKISELDNCKTKTINFQASTVKLIQSVLSQEGSTYTTLQTFDLQ